MSSIDKLSDEYEAILHDLRRNAEGSKRSFRNIIDNIPYIIGVRYGEEPNKLKRRIQSLLDRGDRSDELRRLTMKTLKSFVTVDAHIYNWNHGNMVAYMGCDDEDLIPIVGESPFNQVTYRTFMGKAESRVEVLNNELRNLGDEGKREKRRYFLQFEKERLLADEAMDKYEEEQQKIRLWLSITFLTILVAVLKLSPRHIPPANRVRYLDDLVLEFRLESSEDVDGCWNDSPNPLTLCLPDSN